MWVSLNKFRDPIFWSWCPALGPPRSRPGCRRKSLRGETGSPSPSSQREDGEPEESVREASRSDSVGKQVSYSLAGAGGLEAGTVQRQRRAWGRWLEGPGPGGWAPGAPPGPFALPPPPSPRLRPSPLAGPSRRRPASPGTRPPPAAWPPPGLRSRPPPLSAPQSAAGLARPAGLDRPAGPAVSTPARSGALLTARLAPARGCGGVGLWSGRWFPPPPAHAQVTPRCTDAPLPPAPPSVKDAGRAAGDREQRHRSWRVPGPSRSASPDARGRPGLRRMAACGGEFCPGRHAPL